MLLSLYLRLIIDKINVLDEILMRVIEWIKLWKFEVTTSGLCAVFALLVSVFQLFLGSPLYFDYYSKPKIVVEQVRHQDSDSVSSSFVVYNQGNSVIKNFKLELGALKEAKVFVLDEPRTTEVKETPLTVDGDLFYLGKRVLIDVPTLYKNESFTVVVRSELTDINLHKDKNIWGLYSPLPAVMFAVHEDGYATLNTSTYALNKKP